MDCLIIPCEGGELFNYPLQGRWNVWLSPAREVECLIIPCEGGGMFLIIPARKVECLIIPVREVDYIIIPARQMDCIIIPCEGGGLYDYSLWWRWIDLLCYCWIQSKLKTIEMNMFVVALIMRCLCTLQKAKKVPAKKNGLQLGNRFGWSDQGIYDGSLVKVFYVLNV